MPARPMAPATGAHAPARWAMPPPRSSRCGCTPSFPPTWSCAWAPPCGSASRGCSSNARPDAHTRAADRRAAGDVGAGGEPDRRAAAVEHARTLRGNGLQLVPLAGIAPERMPLHMSAADALILTSYSEGSPNVVKESMACNLPVVSVPVGDVPERLADVTGCAIRPRDPAALGDA